MISVTLLEIMTLVFRFFTMIIIVLPRSFIINKNYENFLYKSIKLKIRYLFSVTKIVSELLRVNETISDHSHKRAALISDTTF